MVKLNCWEFMKCGRQPGGEKAKDLGVCPASIEVRAHGINHGINGGRSCWAISGTLCKGGRQGTYAEKLGDCLKCEFFSLVRKGEGGEYENSKDILRKIPDLRKK